MPPSDSGRPVLFALIVLALVASALALALRGGPDSGSSSGPSVPSAGLGSIAPTSSPGAPAPAERAQVRRAAAATARRFLPAYLRYEAGDLGPIVARALRASATAEFAAALLGAPPRPTGGGRLPAPGRQRRFRVRLVPGSPEWAALSGTAERSNRTERLSFVLERRGGRWLVSGVGE